MEPSTGSGSASHASKKSIHVCTSEDATPGRYTCYDIGTFLALNTVLATTCTVDVAKEAFEQSESVSKAHQKIMVTDAHAGLARGSNSKLEHRIRGDQTGEKKEGRMRSRVGSLMNKVVRN